MRADLYRIEAPYPGRLAIVPRPRGGDWLENEVRSWKQAGLDVVVSMLTVDEAADLDLAREDEACRNSGIEFVAFPTVDRGVPANRKTALGLLRRLEAALGKGNAVGVHCRQGIGRSALVAACLLVLAGVDPEAAIQRVSAARGFPVPETAEQRKWIVEFAQELATSAANE